MPPAYEVLLLNTAIPQIQAAQSGDTYVVPRDIAFSTVASLAAGTEALPSLVATGDVNTGFWFPAADTIAASTGGTRRLTLDSSGNLGLGVTPSAWRTSNSVRAIQANAGSVWSFDTTLISVIQNGFYNASGTFTYANTGYATEYYQYLGEHIWRTAASGTANTTTITNGVSYTIITSGNQTAFGAANNNVGTAFTATSSGTLSSGTVSQNISFTQAMTLDASGNLGVGTTSPASGTRITIDNSGFNSFLLRSSGVDRISLYGDAAVSAVDGKANPLAFYAGSAERARITSGGYFKASNTGTYTGATGAYHEFNSNFSDYIVWTKNSVASGPFGIRVQYSAATPNGTGNEFLVCDDSTATRMTVRSNGGIANYSANDVNLASDERLKKDISPLESTWNRLKAVEVVNFRYKDSNEGDPLLYGVIAQQVQPIVPELVVVTKEAQEAVESKDAILDADGNVVEPAVAAKEATPEYYGIREQPMYWLAIKALQEAMARIETLEAEVAALKGA